MNRIFDSNDGWEILVIIDGQPISDVRNLKLTKAHKQDVNRINKYLGNLLPLIPLSWKACAYWGSCTKLMSQSVVCSIVQLWTSDRVQISHSSRTEMCMSSSRWNAFCRFSYPFSYFSSSRKNWQPSREWTFRTRISSSVRKLDFIAKYNRAGSPFWLRINHSNLTFTSVIKCALAEPSSQRFFFSLTKTILHI